MSGWRLSVVSLTCKNLLSFPQLPSSSLLFMMYTIETAKKQPLHGCCYYPCILQYALYFIPVRAQEMKICEILLKASMQQHLIVRISHNFWMAPIYQNHTVAFLQSGTLHIPDNTFLKILSPFNMQKYFSQ